MWLYLARTWLTVGGIARLSDVRHRSGHRRGSQKGSQTPRFAPNRSDRLRSEYPENTGVSVFVTVRQSPRKRNDAQGVVGSNPARPTQ